MRVIEEKSQGWILLILILSKDVVNSLALSFVNISLSFSHAIITNLQHRILTTHPTIEFPVCHATLTITFFRSLEMSAFGEFEQLFSELVL